MIKDLVSPSTKILQTATASRTAKGFSVGQTVKALVVASLPSNQTILNINGQNIYAKSNAPLDPGTVLNLKVIALTPKPTMEVTNELPHGGTTGELFPPVVTINENTDAELTRQVFENVTDTIEATILEQSGNTVKIKVADQVLEGTISDRNFSETAVKLKVVSMYPKIVLEILSNQRPLKAGQLASRIEKYLDMRELLSSRSPVSAEQNVSPGSDHSSILSDAPFVRPNQHASLDKAETWLKILKDMAHEFTPSGKQMHPPKDQAQAALSDIKVLTREINLNVANEKQFLLPLSFPLDNKECRADIIIKRDREKGASEKKGKDVFNAFVCLNTDLLGTLNMRVQLAYGKVSVSIKGNLSNVVKLISESLAELEEHLKEQGFRVGLLSAAYEPDDVDVREVLTRELLNIGSTKMDVVA